MEKYDYKAALDYNERDIEDVEFLLANKDMLASQGSSVNDVKDSLSCLLTIRHSLRFAEKMMKKPSKEAIEAGWNAFGGPDATFTAMRDAALKELGE